jgi:pimeloyl-ACP methyl ester carboxylesterase
MQVLAGGTALEVELHGPDDGEPLLMIMGLGMQLTAWPQGLVEGLAARGFRVIRFDNRDIGLSQRFDHLGAPNLVWEGFKYLLRLPVRSPYALLDLARDASALLEVIGVERAHVCGASMGGMVAQRLAQIAPEKVASLTLMMTSAGARHLPHPTPAVRRVMLARPRRGDRDAAIAHYIALFRAIGSPAHPMPEGELRRLVAANLARGGSEPGGVLRQLAAIAADGDRSAMLGRLALPVHVIHGQADPLLPLAHGQHLAGLIPGASFDAVPGLGHDLPEALWPRFVDGVAAVAGRSGKVGKPLD